MVTHWILKKGVSSNIFSFQCSLVRIDGKVDVSNVQHLYLSPHKQPLLTNSNSEIVWSPCSWCWYKGGQLAKQSNCTTTHGGLATVTFYVERTTANDAGDYVLHGRNRHGQVRSSTFSLRMAGKLIPHLLDNLHC